MNISATKTAKPISAKVRRAHEGKRPSNGTLPMLSAAADSTYTEISAAITGSSTGLPTQSSQPIMIASAVP